MHAIARRSGQFEMSLSSGTVFVHVTRHAASVSIRTPFEFSSREKLFLIRYLSAEGFLPDEYRPQKTLESGFYPGLVWSVGASLAQNHSACQKVALGQILRLTFFLGLVWLGLLALAFLGAFSP